MAALGLVGCAEAPAPSSWVGFSGDSDVVFAAVEEDGAIRAYTCGGPTTYETRSRWFVGEVDEAGAFLLTRGDGWTLEGEIRDTATHVELSPPSGDATTFSVRPANQGEGAAAKVPEGLYDVTDAGCRTGAVAWVDEVGEQHLQGTWCDSADHFAQVTPVMPIALFNGGLEIRVDLTFLGEGTRDLVVMPSEAP